jgi:Protein of unknown function (DUF1552)
MKSSWQITRRHVLQGLGTALALPLLDAMNPAMRGLALSGAAAAGEAERPPLRMAFLYAPNGKHMADWTPKATGSDFELPWILEPLAKVKEDLCVLSGLTQQKANANGDGPGDHARALATFLTGKQARKTSGADIRAGVSVDQLAADKLGRFTRFPSLEIGCDAGAQSGNCDSGYSCAYSSNIAWKTETMPLAKEINPKLVFERLFSTGRAGESEQARAKRERYEKSVLDFVLEDARGLRTKLGLADQRKLDEYLNSIREIERRIAWAASRRENASPDQVAPPAGIPADYGEHLRLMGDLMALAFQADVTRVATYIFANEGSNRSYAFIDVPEGHHDLSHHGGDEKKHEKIKKINRFHVTQLAYLLEKLKGMKEGEGTLLDNCMIVYGSGIGDGNLHNHNDLPVLLAGRGAGTVKSGRHMAFPDGTPLTNLYLSMLDRAGAERDSLGDSTGRLSELAS